MVVRRIGLILTVTAAATLVVAAQDAPQQRPGLTFRSIANYVEVDAIVTDAAGEPVRDLTCSDFDVREDGKPQALNVCGFVDIPIDRPDPPLFKGRTIEPDVVTNEKVFDGRVFMIVLDSFHVSPLRAPGVRKAAQQFVEKYMGENDLGAVVHVGSSASGQEFTSNKRLLVASIVKFTGNAIGSVTDSINRDAQSKDIMQSNYSPGRYVDPGPAGDMDAPMREYMAKESIDTVRRLSVGMEALGGRRKAVLFFSEGTGLDFAKAGPNEVTTIGSFQAPHTDPTWIRATQDRMVAAAAKANVSVYSIDPRGLSAGPDDAGALGLTSAAEPEGSVLRDFSNSNIMIDAEREVRRSKDILREFAEQTGGLALVDKNDINDSFRRIVVDNSAYYVLGYQSPDPRHDGRFHKISVSMKRAGLQVRTRQGYYSPDDSKPGGQRKPADAVVQLLGSPIPVGGLGMRSSASVVKGLANASTVHLTVEFNGRDVPLKPSGGLFTNEISVEYIAIDSKGVSHANAREIARLQLGPARQAAFTARGVRYVTEFALPTGRYQLRVAAKEHLSGRSGSIFSDLDVPDVVTPSLAMSDMLLTSSSAKLTATPNNTSTVGSLLPAPTTTSREFTAADTLTAAVSLYDNDTRGLHQIDYKTTVYADSGAQQFTREDHREAKDMSAAKGGFPWVVDVPLTGLTPGRYVLAMEAKSRFGDVPAVKRETEFRIK